MHQEPMTLRNASGSDGGRELQQDLMRTPTQWLLSSFRCRLDAGCHAACPDDAGGGYSEIVLSKTWQITATLNSPVNIAE